LHRNQEMTWMESDNTPRAVTPACDEKDRAP